MSSELAQLSTVQAVVFDLDGVLIDSEGQWDEVRRALAANAGRPWPAGATRAMQGMSTAEWSGYLADSVGVPGPAAEIADAVIDQLAARYRRELPLISGAVAAVERLGARWPLGLASSSPRRLVDAVLSSAGLTELFDVTRSTEEVDAGKPSPAVYLEVARRLGVEPTRTVAIEDSSNGLRSAAAAGMAVVAIPHAAFPPAEDALALAAAQVESLADLSPELIESLLPPR
jgi:HAD superfamily hydrolase (TIGR01509 family)